MHQQASTWWSAPRRISATRQQEPPRPFSGRTRLGLAGSAGLSSRGRKKQKRRGGCQVGAGSCSLAERSRGHSRGSSLHSGKATMRFTRETVGPGGRAAKPAGVAPGRGGHHFTGVGKRAARRHYQWLKANATGFRFAKVPRAMSVPLHPTPERPVALAPNWRLGLAGARSIGGTPRRLVWRLSCG
jgi:hypothetical protein